MRGPNGGASWALDLSGVRTVGRGRRNLPSLNVPVYKVMTRGSSLLGTSYLPAGAFRCRVLAAFSLHGPSTMDEAIRLRQAREAIEQGRLPRRPSDRTQGALGTDAPCSVCGAPIGKKEVEFEVRFASVGVDPPRFDVHHFHARCFRAWELTRREMKGEDASVSPPRPAGEHSV